MALVRFGGGVSEIVGSIAGNVFARNRGGAYIRNRTKPINPNTVPQSEWRQKFGRLMNEFSALDEDVKQGWNAFAESVERTNKLGEKYTPSGVQCFMEQNLNLVSADLNLTTFAPSGEPETKPMIWSIVTQAQSLGNNLMEFNLDASANDSASSFIVEVSTPFASRKSSTSVKYRHVTTLANLSSQNIADAVKAVYGNLDVPIGSIFWVRVRGVDAKGFSGEWAYSMASTVEHTD